MQAFRYQAVKLHSLFLVFWLVFWGRPSGLPFYICLNPDSLDLKEIRILVFLWFIRNSLKAGLILFRNPGNIPSGNYLLTLKSKYNRLEARMSKL